MKNKMQNKTNVILLLLAFSNMAIYGVPYIKDMFYDLMIEALQISHGQLGVISSVYGIVATISYLFGGMIADKCEVKNLLIISLTGMGVLSLAMSWNSGYIAAAVIMGGMGIFSILTFYPALIKQISILGGEESQGNAFGIFNFGTNCFSALCMAAFLGFLAASGYERSAFFVIVRTYGILCLVSAVLVWRTVKKSQRRVPPSGQKKRNYRKLLKSGIIWKIAGMIFATYFIASCLAYINPYLTQCMGLENGVVYAIGIVRMNVLIIVLSPVVGKAVDRAGSSLNLITGSFVLLTVCFGILTCFYNRTNLCWGVVALIMAVSAATVSLRVIAYIPIHELGIPEEIQGTVIGIVSFIGYLPDSFYYSVMGKILDLCGNRGFQIMFLVSGIIAVCGIWCSRSLMREKGRKSMSEA